MLSFIFHFYGKSISEKLSKIKKVERLELEEEQRQADLAAAASAGRGETEPAKT